MRHDLIEALDDALDGGYADMDYAMFEPGDVADVRAVHPEFFIDPTPIDLNCDPTEIQGRCVAQYRGLPIFETTMSDEEWDAL